MAVSTNSTITSAIPRRGFLRQLVGLPMIGGGVTLLGRPTAAAVPITDALLDTYNTWLDMERRHLAWERANGDARLFAGLMKLVHLDNPAGDWHCKAPSAAGRAALVLSAAGVELTGGARG